MRIVAIGSLIAALTAVSATASAQPLGGPSDPMAGKPVAQATDADKKQASTTFKRAKTAFDDGRYQDALNGFKASYATVASPNAQLMIAASLAALGRKAEAYQMLKDVIANAEAAAKTNEKYAATAQSARDRQNEVKAQIGFVVLANADKVSAASVRINGREITSDRWSAAVPVEAGDLSIEITGQEIRNVTVAAGTSITVDMLPKADEQPLDDIVIDDSPDPGPDKILIAMIAGGVAAGGFLTFGIFGGIALGNFGSLEDECTMDKKCSAELKDKADDGQTFQVVANVGLAIGIIGAVVAGGFLTWEFAFTEESPTPDEPPTPTAAVKVAPGAVMLHGSF